PERLGIRRNAGPGARVVHAGRSMDRGDLHLVRRVRCLGALHRGLQPVHRVGQQALDLRLHAGGVPPAMRTIPLALKGHLEGGRTSLCFLVKMRLKDGTLLSFTTLDEAVTYTDGPDGPITYSPDNGVTPSEQVWSGSMS